MTLHLINVNEHIKLQAHLFNNNPQIHLRSKPNSAPSKSHR